MGDVAACSVGEMGSVDASEGARVDNAGERDGDIAGGVVEGIEKACSPCSGDNGSHDCAQESLKANCLVDEGFENVVVGEEQGIPNIDLELPKKVVEGEQCEFIDLSPLRNVEINREGTCGDIDITSLFNEGGECNGCEKDIPVSSVLIANSRLEDVQKDAAKEADESWCRTVSADNEAYQIDERNGNLHHLAQEKVHDHLLELEIISANSLELMIQKEIITIVTHSLEGNSTSLQVFPDEEGCRMTEVQKEISDVVRDSPSNVAHESSHTVESADCVAHFIDDRHEKLQFLEPEKELFGLEIASASSLECMVLQNENTGIVTRSLERNCSSPQVFPEEEGCHVTEVQKETSNLVQDSPSEVASLCREAGSRNLSIDATHCLSGLNVTPETQGGDVAVVDVDYPTCSTYSADCCGKAANKSGSDPNSRTLVGLRRSNPKRAASMKGSQTIMQSDKLTRKKSNARKGREASETNSLISSSVFKDLHVPRKRSCSRKRPRLSNWGASKILGDIIRNNNEAILSNSLSKQFQTKRPKKGICTSDKRKQNRGQRECRSQTTRNRDPALSNPIHINDTIEAMAPVIVHSEVAPEVLRDDLLPYPDFSVDFCFLRESFVGENREDKGNAKLSLVQQKRQQADKDLDSIVTQDTSVENMQGDCIGISSQIRSEAVAEIIGSSQSTEPGTSPDSDVFHPTPDVGIVNGESPTSVSVDPTIDRNVLLGPKIQDDHHAAVMVSSETFGTTEFISPPDTSPCAISVKKKKGEPNAGANEILCPVSEYFSAEGNLHLSKQTKKARNPLRRNKVGGEKHDGSDKRNSLYLKTTRKTSINNSEFKILSVKSSVSEMVEFCNEATRVETDWGTCTFSGQGVKNAYSEAGRVGDLLAVTKSKGCKLPRSNKTRFTKGDSGHSDSAGGRKKQPRGKKKESSQKSNNKGEHKLQSQKVDTHQEASTGKAEPGSEILSEDALKSVMAPLGDGLSLSVPYHGADNMQSLPPQVAWVLCDDCQKWRCISVDLADKINETKCRWTCKDNTDKAFADCSIPQEKTDSQINAELGISEEDCSNIQPNPMAPEPVKLAASHQEASWKLIKSNLFLHRNRRTQTIDEIMVCHCKSPNDGSLGCGEQCLNRMLNIECIRGTCPCGDLCSNQQFQKRKYAKFQCFPCGKKGYGLKVLENVHKGQFLIEYVGEVLDLSAYEARQRYYASRGQKHFYFMTLNGGEVIDACAKGNLGRFINHSCDPNCRTEKWMVNGEVCVGLFAIRDIKEGEEVTFDYNYVRVFGAAAKKCVCSSSECRGYIGGDPSNSEIIVQDDSDEEFPEPIMVHETLDEPLSGLIDVKIVEQCDICAQPLGETSVLDPEIHHNSEANLKIPVPDPIQSDEVVCRPLSEVHQSKISMQNPRTTQTGETISRSISDYCSQLNVPLQALSTSDRTASISIEDKQESKQNIKPYPHAKPLRRSATLKKGPPCVKGVIPHKAKQVLASGGNGHFEGVEQKLNVLLDAEGGISKRKDATKGYLKLLFVTAAEGDNVRGIRDLLLILDALLKTRSRLVLTDIINKNGLQMLHNIIKQNRSNFNRTPIIRKLLKVLEFLAMKGILTPEHMNKGPPCDGMESFRESILSLTKHDDTQVHQIARNFREKWIPRSIRSVAPSDRDYYMLDSEHPHCNRTQSNIFRRWHGVGARESDAIVCVSNEVDLHASSHEADVPTELSQQAASRQLSISADSTNNNLTTSMQPRKRKSRWDTPEDARSPDQVSGKPTGELALETGSKFMMTTGHITPGSQHDMEGQNSNTKKEENSSAAESAIFEKPFESEIDDEAPPGFGSSLGHICPQALSEGLEATGEVALGHLQERYISHLSVSYGMPLDVMKQFGTYESGGNQHPPCWAIAPGMPFHPFPPLPPYPHPSSGALPQMSADYMVTEGGDEGAKLTKVTSNASSNYAFTSNRPGRRLAGGNEAGARHWQRAGRGTWHSRGSGNKFFRPQRWNHKNFQRRWPPWPREQNGNEMRGSCRNGNSWSGVGNKSYVGGGFHCSEGVSSNGGRSEFHQQ